jgi:hypothetical protein
MNATKIDGTIAGFDIDDTSLEQNPNFTADGEKDGRQFVVLCGSEVFINDTFKPSGDTLVNLREAFGSTDPATGELWGRIWDNQCKLSGELTFEEHLRLQFEDVFRAISLEQAIEFAKLTLKPKKGFANFLKFLQSKGVTPVFITNGADLIAEPVIKHFFADVLNQLPQPTIYANKLIGDQLKGLHGSVGLAKGEVVKGLGDVLFFFGDSGGGDGPGAQAVHDAGGHVFTLGGKGPSSLFAFSSKNLNTGQWTHLNDYETVPAQTVAQVLASRQSSTATT